MKTQPHQEAARNLDLAARGDRPLAGLLQGQTAVVTGASSGIGKAIAISLSRAGANVVVNYPANRERA